MNLELKTYLKKKGLTSAAFAGPLKLTYQAVDKWLDGLSTPSDNNKIKIERITNGEVPISSWFKPHSDVNGGVKHGGPSNGGNTN